MNHYYDGFESHVFETSDHVKLHYLVKGTGKTLILLHGLAASHANYCKVAPALSEKYRVYVVDMRGHGLSDIPAHGARIARLAKDMYEFQQHIGAEKASWAGHSMGNAVIWSMIDLFGQDHIESIIMIDQSAWLFGNPADSDAKVREYAGMRFDIWQLYNAYHTSVDEGNAAVARYYPMGEFPENPLVWATLSEFDIPPRDGAFIGKLFMDHIVNDWRDTIPRICVPALYVGGGRSYASTRECDKWIVDHVPGCKYLLTPEGTHAGMTMQYAPEICEAITELLG